MYSSAAPRCFSLPARRQATETPASWSEVVHDLGSGVSISFGSLYCLGLYWRQVIHLAGEYREDAGGDNIRRAEAVL